MIRSAIATFKGGSPIHLPEFRHALMSIWGNRKDARIGLAVSGGVDSMALAQLCAWLAKDESLGLSFSAFVVDHKLRKESEEEALYTAQRLKSKVGLDAEVLPLEWEEGVNPQTIPDFESQARKLRYRALGTACRRKGISAILTAHHADDQAETVLMRLAAGHSGLGLRGIQPVKEIPECFGLYGIHQSGGGTSMLRDASLTHNKRQRRRHWSNAGIETGGIQVLRPLLGFSKERLVATCQYGKLKWFEDKTNRDPTLTMRNAVRYLLQESQLPAALRKESLLRLAARMTNRMEKRTERAERLLEKTIVKLDSRSGTLTVQFPHRVTNDTLTLDAARQSAAILVRRLVEMVTPQETVSLQQISVAIRNIYPELFPSDTDKPAWKSSPTTLPSFTCAGIQFQRHDESLSESRALKLQPCIWHLSRQLYPRTPPTTTTNASATTSSSTLHISIPGRDHSPLKKPIRESSFHLFDNRFWLRVFNPTEYDLVIRPFAKEDLKHFRASLTPQTKRAFDKLLAEVAPGHVRLTLPAIATVSDRVDRRGKSYMGGVIAMPTLSIRSDGNQTNRINEVWERVEWDVRFRKVEPGKLAVEDVVVAPLTASEGWREEMTMAEGANILAEAEKGEHEAGRNDRDPEAEEAAVEDEFEVESKPDWRWVEGTDSEGLTEVGSVKGGGHAHPLNTGSKTEPPQRLRGEEGTSGHEGWVWNRIPKERTKRNVWTPGMRGSTKGKRTMIKSKGSR